MEDSRLTRIQRQSFIDYVKGKKIAMIREHNSFYIIPSGKWGGSGVDDDVFYGVNNCGNEDYFWIEEGMAYWRIVK